MHVVELPLNDVIVRHYRHGIEEVKDEIVDFLTDIGCSEEDKNACVISPYSAGDGRIAFEFSNADHAIMFKLAWGGISYDAD